MYVYFSLYIHVISTTCIDIPENTVAVSVFIYMYIKTTCMHVVLEGGIRGGKFRVNPESIGPRIRETEGYHMSCPISEPQLSFFLILSTSPSLEKGSRYSSFFLLIPSSGEHLSAAISTPSFIVTRRISGSWRLGTRDGAGPLSQRHRPEFKKATLTLYYHQTCHNPDSSL